MQRRVVLAGATGWAGGALARGIATTADLRLVGAVARKHAGTRLGDVLGEPRLDCTVSGSVAEALAIGCDVFFEYTKPEYARAHVLAALEAGAHVVIGTSGLANDDFATIDRVAQARGRGVLACGNFAITVVLLQRFAELAARYVPSFEVIEFAHAGKRDAPSGTARELAHRLAQVRTPELAVPLDQVVGPVASRGATLDGVQVHSMRVPGFVVGVEAVFGLPDQRLHLRHEAGASAAPYVDGALLAIREVDKLVGLHRGLDRVMQW